MICKSCQEEYTEADPWTWQKPPFYGWHPMYGECFMCFCYAMFGGMMEPWGDEATRAKQAYQITPPGVPSPCSCSGPPDSYWDSMFDSQPPF